ncbi:hypothetical protein GYA44_00910 [Candidatus Microgenomates bacterium]|jgi:hypothetical protein|nr:hypothetical protein [Candidatus Microgenomates bacterium]
MSKLLRRAIKISLWPSFIMILAKLLGMVAVGLIYDLKFFVDNNINGIFSVQIYFTDFNTTLFVNSISNLVMLIALAIPTFYFIIKTSIYQSSLQNPKTIVKITKLNILNWITKKDTSFLLIFLWSSFLTLASGIIVLQTIQGNCYTSIGIISGVVSLLSIWGTIKTFELETDNIYPRNNRYY